MWPEVYIAFALVSIALFLTARSFSNLKKGNQRAGVLDNLTVIIPFRNEAQHLKRLLDSIDDQISQPKKILFVNDHSDDNGELMVEEWSKGRLHVELIALDATENGKKSAIQKGVYQAETELILTLDADTWFSKKYFDSLKLSKTTNLQGGPVVLKGKGIIQKFFSLEFLFFNSFNYLIFPVYPLSVSGANLIYRKADYKKYNNLEEHKTIASGDDHFLLRNFHRIGLSNEMVNDVGSKVYSDAPNGFKEYFAQRLRWFGKTVRKTTVMEFLLGIYISLYILGGFVTLLFCLFQIDFIGAALIVCTRFILDGLIYLLYTIPLKETKGLFMLLFFQVFYPPLYLMVILGGVFVKPTWKGREIT